MAETVAQLSEIEDMLQQLPAAKRTVVLKCLTDLFVEDSRRYQPEHIALFDTLFSQLTTEIDTGALAAFSRRLAPLTTAPAKTIGRLALNDDISVAEPVLVSSPRAEDAILMDIARTKGQMHLLAIACRPKLAAAIVDLLIERGDDVVVRYVANNQGARLSEAGLLALINRAKTDDALADIVKQRDDIPRHLLKTTTAKTAKTPAQTEAKAAKRGSNAAA